MRPAIVIPMNDPKGMMFPHLFAILPDLKKIFERGYISIPQDKHQIESKFVKKAQADPFFKVLIHQKPLTVGEDFKSLYEFACDDSSSNQLLHLGFIDRIAFALQSDHRKNFISDVTHIESEQVPLIFQRSEYAWQTHPKNYRVFEKMVEDAGEHLFGKRVDFAWCYLVLTVEQLKQVLPFLSKKDISIVAEVILPLLDIVNTKDIDWLAWEDPFIFDRQDTEAFKVEREQCQAENLKRLQYVLPMLELLQVAARERLKFKKHEIKR